tara:strand:+ start:3965 stop:4246 length:282 start_codon:yes stop_codon:yes gene_type:complete
MEEYKYIVRKFELLNGELLETSLGYLIDSNQANQVNVGYENYCSWVNDNKLDLETNVKTIAEYFNTIPVFYGYTTISTNVYELTEITDITPYI